MPHVMKAFLYAPTSNFIQFPTQDLVFTSGIYYGDASGGEMCALAGCDDAGNVLVSTRFNLPGPVQTVPRAELFVLHYLVQGAAIGSTCIFGTDNKKNADLYNR